jgi:hypothetical protein
MSEGGIGWPVMLADRVDYVLEHSASGQDSGHWTDDLRPSEVLAQRFWFCSIDDPGSIDGFIARFGSDHLTVESDYPHADSTWPDTQALVVERYGRLGDEVLAKVSYANAAALFRHPLPPDGGA